MSQVYSRHYFEAQIAADRAAYDQETERLVEHYCDFFINQLKDIIFRDMKKGYERSIESYCLDHRDGRVISSPSFMTAMKAAFPDFTIRQRRLENRLFELSIDFYAKETLKKANLIKKEQSVNFLH